MGAPAVGARGSGRAVTLTFYFQIALEYSSGIRDKRLEVSAEDI